MSDIRRRVEELLERRPDLSGPQLAAYTSLALGTVRHWLSGSNHYSDIVDRQMERVLAQVEAGEILRDDDQPVWLSDLPAARPKAQKQQTFYVTKTVNKVGQVMAYCASRSVIGVITADYGAGKTEAAKHWLQGKEGSQYEHTFFEFHTFVNSGVTEFINALARAVGAPARAGRMNGAANFDSVCEFLRANPRLLVIDQCESTSPGVLQAIRQVWDRTKDSGVGVVLMASPLLTEKLKATRMRDVGALSSRVAVWAELRGLERGEAATIIREEGLEKVDADAQAMICRLCEGSMRRLLAMTRLLVEKHGNRVVTMRTVHGAAQMLWGVYVPLATNALQQEGQGAAA